MKKFCSIVIVIVMLIASVSSFSIEANAVSGSSDGCSWELNGSVLTIKGSGTVNVGQEPSWRNRVTDIVIEEGPVAIDFVAFRDFESLKRVTLPSTIKKIGKSAFSGCTSLISINIPENLSVVDDGAFSCCYGLVDFNVPKSLTMIGEHVFVECYALAYINVDKDNPVYSSEGGVLFNKDKTKLIRYPAGNKTLNKYTIPDTVVTIEDNAFQGAWALKDIDIPDTVMHIGTSAFDRTTPYNDNSRIENGVLYIDNHVIEVRDKNLTECRIKSGTKSIASGAFVSVRTLKKVIIPEGITAIGKYAFWYDTALESVFIPISVRFIGMGAFESCDSLKNVYYADSRTSARRITIEGYNEDLTNATWSHDTCIGGKDHNFGEAVENLAPTCTVGGESSKKCSVCGFERITKTASLGHKNEVWSQTKAPTCVESGTEESICVTCSEIITRSIDPKQHVFVPWYVDVAATCTSEGIEKRTCVLCNELEARNLEPLGHSFGEWEVSREATCEEKGENKRICPTCETVETEPISATGHDYGEAVITKKPTTRKVGSEESTCKKCGDVRVTEIPMLDKADIDTTLIIIIGGVLASLALAIVLVLLIRRKK